MAKNSKGTTKGSRPGYSRAGSQAQAPARRGAGFWALLAGGAALAAVVVAVALSSLSGGGSTASVEKGNGGSWTNVDANQLATMMQAKDFTLLNVKTPYIGEIAGTDLYIPYTDVAARAPELPAERAARIVVYCRTGHESAIAAQTLLDLGYTNILNLDGGMTAWTASGRQLVQLNRG